MLTTITVSATWVCTNRDLWQVVGQMPVCDTKKQSCSLFQRGETNRFRNVIVYIGSGLADWDHLFPSTGKILGYSAFPFQTFCHSLLWTALMMHKEIKVWLMHIAPESPCGPQETAIRRHVCTISPEQFWIPPNVCYRNCSTVNICPPACRGLDEYLFGWWSWCETKFHWFLWGIVAKCA